MIITSIILMIMIINSTIIMIIIMISTIRMIMIINFHHTDDHDHLRSGAALQSMNKGTNPVLMRLNSSVMLCPPLPCDKTEIKREEIYLISVPLSRIN